ncbi:hypothetical protein ES708_27069 [subsurface metagenome]
MSFRVSSRSSNPEISLCLNLVTVSSIVRSSIPGRIPRGKLKVAGTVYKNVIAKMTIIESKK